LWYIQSKIDRLSALNFSHPEALTQQ